MPRESPAARPRPAACGRAALLALALGAGCGAPAPEPPPPDGSETAVRLRALLELLGDYAMDTRAHNPDDLPLTEQKFRKYLRDGIRTDRLEERLRAAQTPTAPDLFVSPRDHESFVINWSSLPFGTPKPVVWERAGVGGRRYVILGDGAVEEAGPDRGRELKLK